MKEAGLENCQINESVFTEAEASQALFTNSSMYFSDCSHARFELARFTGADLTSALLHGVQDDGADWSGAKRKGIRGTDQELLEAEMWEPLQP